ncbi:hypothetical protein ON010_g108 [Phytophthora cinnamomi]|nr:hypothetical protein ON010_g108 [Phytophthora cinnamomi]
MDLSAAWHEVALFQETGIVTCAHLYASEQENALVHEFLAKIPIATLFACLQDASDRGSAKQVKQACSCINRVLGAEGDGTSLFFQPDVRRWNRYRAIPPAIAFVLTWVDFVTDCALRTGGAGACGEGGESAGGEPVYLAPGQETLAGPGQSRETIVKICAQKDEHMEYGVSMGAIDLILNCLKSDDPLFLMNVVDLAPVVCQTKIGVQYIFESGTLKTLLGMTEDPFVGGNAVRLVGEISAEAASLNIESWSWSDATLSKAFLETVEGKMQSADSLQQIAAMDALAAFGSSSGKERGRLEHVRAPVQQPRRRVRTAEHDGAAHERAEAAVRGAAHVRISRSAVGGRAEQSVGHASAAVVRRLLRVPHGSHHRTDQGDARVEVRRAGRRARLAVPVATGYVLLASRFARSCAWSHALHFRLVVRVVCGADASLLEKLEASLRRGPYAGAAAPAEMELESA